MPTFFNKAKIFYLSFIFLRKFTSIIKCINRSNEIKSGINSYYLNHISNLIEPL